MVFHGVGMNWGITSGIAGVVGAFQTRDHSFKMDCELIKDTSGTTVSKVYSDYHEEATFTYIALGPINNSAIEPVTMPSVGTWVEILDSYYPQIAGYWSVDEVTTKGSNTSAVKVEVKLSRYPFVDPAY